MKQFIAAARASLERASKAADLIGTGTKIFDFYPQCIWIFYHNALHSHCPNDVVSLVQCLRRLRLVSFFFLCVFVMDFSSRLQYVIIKCL